MKIAAFASGNGSNVEALVKSGIKIDLLICNKQNAYVLARAKKLNIKTYVVVTKNREQRVFEQEMLDILKSNEIELILLAGYMRQIGATLLDQYEGSIINIHPSLLPAFKGPRAIVDAYNYGVKVSGVTIHLIDSELDAGTIIMQEPVILDEGISLEQFEQKIHEVEYQIFYQAVNKIIKERK